MAAGFWFTHMMLQWMVGIQRQLQTLLSTGAGKAMTAQRVFIRTEAAFPVANTCPKGIYKDRSSIPGSTRGLAVPGFFSDFSSP